MIGTLKRIYRSLAAQRIADRIPYHRLGEEHLRNARLITDRIELLKRMPKNAVVAELGVDEGGFSQQILTHCDPKKLHLVDAWSTGRYHQGKRQAVEERFAERIAKGQVQLDLGLSTEVVRSFADAYFDWIYIDTDHTYSTTIAELRLYDKKVKKGGIIAGHDYVIGNWVEHVRYGVIEAVHQFCVESNWELIYISTDLDIHPSFAIRRI